MSLGVRAALPCSSMSWGFKMHISARLGIGTRMGKTPTAPGWHKISRKQAVSKLCQIMVERDGRLWTTRQRLTCDDASYPHERPAVEDIRNGLITQRSEVQILPPGYHINAGHGARQPETVPGS
jgi:hypothetical protein